MLCDVDIMLKVFLMVCSWRKALLMNLCLLKNTVMRTKDGCAMAVSPLQDVF